MKKEYLGLSVAIIVALSCLPYTTKLVNDTCVNEAGKRKVLIAMQRGQFKDSVIATVKGALERDSYCVKVIPFGDLGSEVMENYFACIIVNTCHGSHIGRKASKFLKKLTSREKEKIVLFTTTGGEGWQPKNTGVDCVTSASKLHKALFVADTITVKTRAILRGK
jgi:hypothetical protein